MTRAGRGLLWLFLCLGLRMGMAVTLPVEAQAHPGRLDVQGCHHVLKPYVFAGGTRVEAGDYHCHRPLGAMKLDTRERLQDPKDPGREELLTKEELEGQ